MGVIKRKRSSLVDDDIDSESSDGHKSRVRETSVGTSQLEFGT